MELEVIQVVDSAGKLHLGECRGRGFNATSGTEGIRRSARASSVPSKGGYNEPTTQKVVTTSQPPRSRCNVCNGGKA